MSGTNYDVHSPTFPPRLDYVMDVLKEACVQTLVSYIASLGWWGGAVTRDLPEPEG